MELNDYQNKASEVAIYPGKGTLTGLLYTALGLGEAGEVQGKVKKIMRDDNMNLTTTKAKEIASEIGDLLWYASQAAAEIDYSLEEIANMNLDKLFDRKDRGVLQGSGDNR